MVNEKKLKEAKIKDGRIWLEDKLLINPEFLGLKVIRNDFENPVDLTSKKVREIIEETLENQRPGRADSYVLGEEKFSRGIGVLSGYNCVLYLNSHGGGK